MDAKYANLPGIAKNEPDTYETSDLVEQINQPQVFEDDSNNVQKISISTKEAFDKFNIKQLNSANADFSDSITSKRKHGYHTDVFEYTNNESNVEKLERIQMELAELKLDFANSQSDKENKSNDKNLDVNLIENLQKEAVNLHLELIGAKVDSNKLDSKIKKQILIDHINNTKKSLNESTSSSSKQTNKSKTEDNSIVFKIFNDLDSSELQKLSKLSDINQRLSRLEHVLGTPSNNKFLNFINANNDNKTILGVVENMDAKLSVIDAQSIEVIESRIQWITQKINQLNEKKNLIEDQEKLNKISELYGLINKWKETSALLPNIIERLAALNELHQQAFQFSSALARLDSDNQSIRQTIETNEKILTTLKTNLDKNLDSIKSNFDNLNQRLVTISSSSSKA